MTNPERIAKIRELLNGIDTQKLFTLAKWFDVQDDNKGVPVEMREVQHDLNKYAIMATEALSLLDGIETEGAIERAMKEGRVYLCNYEADTVEWTNGKYRAQIAPTEDRDARTVYSGDDVNLALASILGEEPPQ